MLKVAVVGGGSTYTPELVNGFLKRVKEFPLEELWLFDIDQERLDVVGGFVRRMVRASGEPFQVLLSTDRQAAISGAAYVITQLRVGQMQARREDEYLGRRHGLIGQETTGVGGMAKALRTIPVILQIAAEMQTLSQPGALLVNFTNPAGLITQALSKYAPGTASVGVCNVPITAKMELIELLEKHIGRKIDPDRAVLNTLGLNHLSWHRGFRVDNEDLWPQIMEATLAELRAQEHPEWDPQTIEALQMIPNYYLQYFYYTAEKLKAQDGWPPSRAEQVMSVEQRLLEQYANTTLVEPPEDLMQRGGAWYSTVATQLLSAHFNDTGEMHIVNITNSGAVKEWPADWVLEIPAVVRNHSITPITTEPLPPAQFGLIAQVKSYEMLTVEAGVHGDHRAAYLALLAHPLGPPADKVQVVLDDLLETHRAYLPQFWR